MTMGGFEIILIAIGIGWTIISGIVKNVEEAKKKKARAAELAQTSEPAIEDAPSAREVGTEISIRPATAPAAEPGVRSRLDAGLQKLRDERIKQIRRRMGLEAAAAAPTAQQPPATTPPVVPPVPPVPKVKPRRTATVPADTPAESPVNPRAGNRPQEASQGSRQRIIALAASPHGLRDAVVLSELLSPPVALRESHLD